ncbi:restriction endonuclease subunit S [Vibrio vulnificus]|uniref:restriction endonuclease subunit S n=1 Tax=Vibrio vulnificus TaxID=672 RepID=UPI0024DFAA2B|nr:restriction endonuclease subunit S [Vibrio vulnificus]MDK2641863.1 restriction endonuclease subunit S [Vibrio vulnificus]
MSELPKGWVNTQIGQVITLNEKLKGIDDEIECGFVPMALMPTAYRGFVNFETKTWGSCKKGFTQFKDDDVLLAKITPCFENGKGGIVTGLPNGIGAGSTEYFVLRCIDELIQPQYLHAFVKSKKFKDDCEIHMGGSVGHKRVPKDYLLKYEIPLAPLKEQIRITNKLDSILAKVDKAQARLDKIPAILKRFRQSVLAAATSGELTKEWREELGIEWSNNVFTVEQIAKKEKYSLGIGPFGSNLKVADYRSEGHPLVFVREIRARQFGGADTKFVEHGKFTELAAHRVKPGNILITKMGDPPGDVAIYPDDCAEAVITSDCIKLDVNEELINKQFVFHYMQSEHFQSQMRAITAGVAQQKVNLKNFKGLTLLAPTMDEQIEINRIISGLMDRADTVEKQYLDAKTRLDRLTQSILAKAFRGELVSQDPNDEPAEKLLERILAEKEQIKPKKTTRKRTTKAKTAEKE